ncbi:L,D-transpeptidase [Paenibacillus lutrae]|uniref:L,D-transpeptidase family protein n=1 Tax=Paenibacillus lutrae TaxID=2078573 RepID=A0A7X3FMV3_9BACL|nr:L,D-transpeptidase [Paenibacillus lutrae]MVP02404.1 L,D-transpeptidase family protein [Paenibacillus lutrae]
MGGSEKRFSHPLEPQLVRLNKNLLISKGDPQYFDKVIRYADKTSPEAHFKMGERAREQGNTSRAMFHYQEVMKTSPSPYYYEANRALRDLALQEQADLEEARTELEVVTRGKFNRFLRMFLYALILINLILLAALLGSAGEDSSVAASAPASAAASSLAAGSDSGKPAQETGSSFSTEAASVRGDASMPAPDKDIPYVMYFPAGAGAEWIESELLREMNRLVQENSRQNRVLYGFHADGKQSGSAVTQGLSGGQVIGEELGPRQAYPLSSLANPENAFVAAEYVPQLRSSIQISYIGEGVPQAQALTVAGAQIIRTALQAYAADHGGTYPASLDLLLRSYPDNYLSFLPKEVLTGSNRVSPYYDGGGGWVYTPAADDPGSALRPNLPAAALAVAQPVRAALSAPANVPLEPVQVYVSKRERRLLLQAGSGTVLTSRAGIGRPESPTPGGTYTVLERVLAPAGRAPGVYGAAALGLGSIAVHGTADAASVGAARSLGCVRVDDAEMLALFALVPKGAAVHVVASLDEPGGPALKRPVSGHGGELAAAAAALGPAQLPPVKEQAPGKVFHWLG